MGNDVTDVKTTVVGFEDKWNATSQRTIDGKDKITIKQEYTYTDGKTESFTRTVTIDEFNKQYASSVERNPQLAEDIKKVAQGRYKDTKIDFSSTLRGQFFAGTKVTAGVTEPTNARGVKIIVGQEYYDPSGEKVRIDAIRVEEEGNLNKAGQAVYMAKRADSPSWINIDLLRSDLKQPLTDIEYPTVLARVLAHGERAIDIYIAHEGFRTAAQSYIKGNSKGCSGTDIRIVVSPNPPPTGARINGRYSIQYGRGGDTQFIEGNPI